MCSPKCRFPAILFLGLTSWFAAAPVAGQVPPQCPDPLALELLPFINDHRADFGVDLLQWDARLHTSANLHAIDIAVNGSNDPWRVIGSNGSTPEERMIAAGFPSPIGEVTVCVGLDLTDIQFSIFQHLGSDMFDWLGPTHVGIGIAENQAGCGAGWIVVVDVGYDTSTVPLAPICYAGQFRRGDANLDGAMDIGDAVWVLGLLFSGGGPSSCQDSADANDDGAIDIGDAVYALSTLFSGGAVPGWPGALICGPDPTADALGCADSTACY